MGSMKVMGHFHAGTWSATTGGLEMYEVLLPVGWQQHGRQTCSQNRLPNKDTVHDAEI